MQNRQAAKITFVLLVLGLAAILASRFYHRRLNNALIEAAQIGDARRVRELLACGADPNYRQTFALVEAVRGGHRETAQFLLAAKADPNASAPENYMANGASLLILLPQYSPDLGKSVCEMMKLLLESGANANVKSASGTTALMMAARYGDVCSVRLLLERGASVNAAAAWGETALMSAVNSNSVAHGASRQEIVRALLAGGADINTRDTNGSTALLAAVEYAGFDASVVTLLLQQGAKVNIANNNGTTALIAASKPEVVRALLKAGADPNIRNNHGYTALKLARQTKRTWEITLLEKAGAKE